MTLARAAASQSRISGFPGCLVHRIRHHAGHHCADKPNTHNHNDLAPQIPLFFDNFAEPGNFLFVLRFLVEWGNFRRPGTWNRGRFEIPELDTFRSAFLSGPFVTNDGELYTRLKEYSTKLVIIERLFCDLPHRKHVPIMDFENFIVKWNVHYPHENDRKAGFAPKFSFLSGVRFPRGLLSLQGGKT